MYVVPLASKPGLVTIPVSTLDTLLKGDSRSYYLINESEQNMLLAEPKCLRGIVLFFRVWRYEIQ